MSDQIFRQKNQSIISFGAVIEFKKPVYNIIYCKAVTIGLIAVIFTLPTTRPGNAIIQCVHVKTTYVRTTPINKGLSGAPSRRLRR